MRPAAGSRPSGEWNESDFDLWFPKISSNRIRAVREYQHIIRNDGCDCPFAGFLGFPLDRP